MNELRGALDVADERAQGVLNCHMMKHEDYRTHATLLCEQVTIVEDKLAVLEEKLAEETEEKERYIELYEEKCTIEEELN